MQRILTRIRSEPAVVRAFLGAVAVLGARFGLDLDGETTAALATLVLIAAGADTRRKVTPV